MIYYTQLVFVRPGKEDAFLEFESHVLPLLTKYDARLVLRLRPTGDTIVATDIGDPYEVHVLAFESKADFAASALDPERQKYLPLKDEAVSTAMLIEGKLL